jgi:hypothetical protein
LSEAKVAVQLGAKKVSDSTSTAASKVSAKDKEASKAVNAASVGEVAAAIQGAVGGCQERQGSW